MLVEEAAQEIVKRRATAEFLGHLGQGLLRAGLLGDRDVDDRRQHLFDQRREALLRYRQSLCGTGGIVRRRGLGPDQRRHGECGAEPKSEDRSEEHTSELQSLRHLVCRLLLEKKKSL